MIEKRRIGSLEVSVIGIGCNNFGKRIDAAAANEVVHAALDAGINFFDTADIYGATKSEELLGRALAGRRSSAIIATKFGMPLDDKRRGAKPDYIRQAAEASLARLGTDYIDLYQLHQPDPDTPIADTLAALDELVRAGKIREIGCSNFSADQLADAAAAVQSGAARFVSVQNQYSLLHREPEADVLPACRRLNIGFIPFFPLASGLLSGKYRSGDQAPQGSRFAPGGWSVGLFTARNLRIVDGLRRFAEARGHSMLDLAFAWLLVHDEVASVIAGAMSADQVKANAGVKLWRLSAAEMSEVASILAAP